MHIARYRELDVVHLGVVDGAAVRPIDLSGLKLTEDVDGIGVAALAASGWRDGDDLALGPARPLDSVQLLAPVPAPQKIICIGVNYGLHAAESSIAAPAFPEVFAKFANAIADPFAPILLPALDSAIDYEGELAVVIGSDARGLQRSEALDAVAGYTIANDVSARTVQLRVSQWVAGKTLDTFCPLGPWLATSGSIPDPQALRLRTVIGEEVLQDASTSEMIFGVADLLVYLSSLMTLRPGDLILTGTPAGVGHARTPRRYLAAGEAVGITIDGIGTLSNPVATDLRGATGASAAHGPGSADR